MDKSETTQHTSVYDWLNDYTQKLENLPATERANELREDYHDESQAYADYLDYMDEWTWHNKEQQSVLVENFISGLAKSHQLLKCDCGSIHTLTTQKEADQGDIIVDTQEILIFTQCWYIMLVRKAKETLAELTQERVRLTQPMENMITTASRWKLDNINSQVILPLEAFKQLWWDRDGKGKKSSNSTYLEKRISHQDKMKIDKIKQKADVIVKETGRRVLLHYVHDEHSFHNFRRALDEPEFREVLSFINYWRTKLGQEHNKISFEDINDSMQRCGQCISQKVRPRITMPGIYYAPPGVGKTTALESGTIVGLDTDWIGVGLTWKDYSMILNKRIPIVTNQYTVFIGSTIKVAGVIKQNIRKDAKGKAFTTKRKLEEYQEKHPQDVTFISISEKKYFEHYVINLQMYQMIQHLIQNYSINQMPFYQVESSEEWRNVYPKLMRKEQFLKA